MYKVPVTERNKVSRTDSHGHCPAQFSRDRPDRLGTAPVCLRPYCLRGGPLSVRAPPAWKDQGEARRNSPRGRPS